LIEKYCDEDIVEEEEEAIQEIAAPVKKAVAAEA